MLKLAAPLSSGRIVPRVTMGMVTPFIPRERPNVKHAIAGYLRLPRPTPAPALMRELHWHRSYAEVPEYTLLGFRRYRSFLLLLLLLLLLF